MKAQTVPIDATVKISVCGDGTVEGPEECERNDLNGNTCVTKGYDSGTVTCSNDCTVNTTQCSNNSTSNDSDEDDEDDDDDTDDTTSSDQSSSIANNTTQIVKLLTGLKKDNKILPKKVALFDTDNNGEIEAKETYKVVEKWVSAWKNSQRNILKEPEAQTSESCDLSGDSICDLKDLSVLLYYVSN